MSDAKTYPYFTIIWSVYGAWGCFLNLILFGYASYQFYLIIRQGWKWTVVTITLCLLMTGILMRILELGIDPHDFRGILGPIASNFLESVSSVLYINAAFLVMLYWIELQTMTGIKSLRSVQRLRPLMIILWILTAVIYFPISLWDAFDSSTAADDANGVLNIIFLLILIISFLISGIRLRIMIKSIGGNAGSNSQEVEIFLKKISVFLLYFSIFASLLVILIIIGIITNVQNSVWGLPLERGIGETFIFVFIGSLLKFISKKKPSSMAHESPSKPTTELSNP